MDDSIGFDNEANKEIMVKWMVANADVLPSRANLYAGLLIGAGVGSMTRVSKKLAKKESFLIDIGIEEDDAEEIVVALLREKNNERVEAIKSQPNSKRLSLNTKSISYQSPMGSPALSTQSLSPNSQLWQVSKSLLNTSLDDASSSAPKKRGLVTSLSTTDLADQETIRTEKAKSLSSSEFAALLSSDDGGGTSTRLKAKRMLSKVDEGEDMPEDILFAPTPAATIVIPLSETLQAQGVVRSPSSGSIDSPEKKSMFVQIAQKTREKGGAARMSLLAAGSAAAGNNPPKDMTELQQLCESIAGDLRAAVEYRNETATIAALTRVYEVSAEEMGYYVNRMGELGACKDISSLLATFTHSVDACLAAAKAISVLCQYNDSRESQSVENMETFGDHGTGTSLLRVLSTHEKNSELVEWICHTIGKLSNTERNITSFTKAGTCEKMLAILQDEHSTVRNCTSAAFVVRSLAQMDASVVTIIQCGLCEGLVMCLKAHMKEEVVCKDMIRAMLMIGHVTAGCLRLGEAGACGAVVESMRENEGSVSLAEWALMALEMFLKCEDNFSRLLQASVCEVLVNCLNHNMQVPNVARGACRAVQLLATNDMIRSKLGNEGACEVFPRALSNHIASPSIAQVSCGAIGALASDHAENKAKLTAAGACDFLILTIQKYSATDAFRNTLPAGYETVVWQACWSLRKLATGGANRNRLETSNACEALHTAAMQHVKAVDVVVQVFRAINVLTSNKTHPIVARMGTVGVCKSVVRAILKNSSSETICKLGAEVMCHLADCPSNVEKLVAAKGFEALSQITTTHAAASDGLAQWSCRSIYMLCTGGEAVQTRARAAGALEAIVWALQRQGKHQDVAEWGIVALKEMATYSSNRQKLGTGGGCEVVISIAKRHSYMPAITHRSCSIIHFLSQEPNNRAWLGASGGCDVVVRALTEHGNVPMVCAAACLAAASLAWNHEGNNNRLRSSGACSLVVESMKRHMSSSHVCDHGCNAVYRLGEFPESVRLLYNANVCPIVISALTTHCNDKGVVLHALQALTVLTNTKYPELYPTLIEAGVNDAVISVLKDPTITDDVAICTEACLVISHLSARQENRVPLGDGGACVIIAGILKQHMQNSAEVVREATIACCELATGCRDNIRKLTDNGVCETLVNCIQHHRASDITAESICRCLVILSEYPTAKAILADADNCKIFVKHLSKMKGDHTAVLWALRLIMSLCHDIPSCGRMGNAGACKVVTASILQYKDNQEAVESGVLTLFRLVEINGSVCEENIPKLCTSETYEVLSTALRLYGDSLDVADPVLRVIVHMTNVPDESSSRLRGSSTDGSRAESESSGAQAVQAVTSQAKPTRWSMFKKTILGDKGERAASSLLSHMPLRQSTTHQNSMDDSSVRHSSQLKLGEAGACEGVVRTMFDHAEVEGTALVACEAMRNLCRESANVDLISRAGGCEVLATIFKQYAGRSESLVANSCAIIIALIKHKAANSAAFARFGTCEILSMTMFFYSDSADTATAVCNATYQLSSTHKAAKFIFAAADACQALLNIFSTHHQNSVVCAAAALALRSMIDGNDENVFKLASISPIGVLVQVLSAGKTDVRVVENVMWILRVLSPCDIGQDGKHQLFADLLVGEIRGLIVNCFFTHGPTSAEVCEEGCRLISTIMEPIAHSKSFLFKNSDIDMCIHFGGAGICDIVASALTTNFSKESVMGACLRVLSLLSRVLNNHYAHDRHKRTSKITKCHTNVETLIGFSIHDTIVKIMQKFPNSVEITRYGVLTLSNLLPGQPVVLESITSATSLKTIFKSMTHAAPLDSSAARFSCVFIYQLATCGHSYHDKLVTGGAGVIVGQSLRTHLACSLFVRDACVAVAKLALSHELAKERLAAAGTCVGLSEVIRAYSLNEEIAVEACIAVGTLMRLNPTICAKFAATDIDTQMLGLLQSFGFGDGECAPIFAEMTCRAMGDFACPEETVERPVGKKGSITSHIPQAPLLHKSHTTGNPHERAERLGKGGFCESLLLVLEKYPTNEEVAEAVCFAVSKMVVSTHNVSQLVAAGAAGVISLAQQQFAGNALLVATAQECLDAMAE